MFPFGASPPDGPRVSPQLSVYTATRSSLGAENNVDLVLNVEDFDVESKFERWARARGGRCGRGRVRRGGRAWRSRGEAATPRAPLRRVLPAPRVSRGRARGKPLAPQSAVAPERGLLRWGRRGERRRRVPSSCGVLCAGKTVSRQLKWNVTAGEVMWTFTFLRGVTKRVDLTAPVRVWAAVI